MRPLALASWFALLALAILWEGWLVPAHHTPLFWLAVKAVPLLVMLPGLLRDRPKAYLGASLLALLFFIEGVVLAWTLRAETLSSIGKLPLAWIEIVATVTFIVNAGLRARQRLRTAG